jgi:hypothetical protein
MKKSSSQSVRLQLEEAVQMLRLVALEERTCMEVAEWLEQNYPEIDDSDSTPILDLLIKSGNKHGI